MLGPLGNPSISRELEVIKDSSIESRSRFNLDDVGFFNSFYENNSINTILIIEYTKKSTFFRDIHIFIDRVKNVIRTKGNKLL